MDNLFEIRVIMAAETVNPFGEGVAAICVQLPHYLAKRLNDLDAHLVRLQINDPEVAAIIQDMRHNTEVAREVGEMISTLIGCATPARVNPTGRLQ